MAKAPEPREWSGLRPGDFGWEDAAPTLEEMALRRALLNTCDDDVQPGHDRLVELLEALVLVEHAIPVLREELVGQARVGGLTWEQIGHGLGLSRTAAHKRFAGFDVDMLERMSWNEVPDALLDAQLTIEAFRDSDVNWEREQHDRAVALQQRHPDRQATKLRN